MTKTACIFQFNQTGYDAIYIYRTGFGEVEITIRGDLLACDDRVDGTGAMMREIFRSRTQKLKCVNWSGTTLISELLI